jgi:RNA 2',3'-cyclic 3'-phosphodiesterase
MESRTFISVPVPVTEELEELFSDLGSVRNLRASKIEQTHITLRFIGDVDDRGLAAVCGCVRKACEGIGPFGIEVAGAGAFPDANRPRIVWIGARSGGNLEALADRMSAELDDAGIGYDTKPFKPHITVGRISGSSDVKGFVESCSAKVFSSFECCSVKVMRSVLSQYGARHYVVESVPLGNR